MSLFNFSLPEIQQLYHIKEELEKTFALYETEGMQGPTDLPAYYQSIKRYEERFNRYKYLIFSMVQGDSWRSTLGSWRDSICIVDEVPFHYCDQLKRLIIWFSFIIPGTSLPVAVRTEHAYFTEFGYEKGLGLMRILAGEVADSSIRSHFQKVIKRSELIHSYAQQLLSIGSSDNPGSRISQWVNDLHERNTDLTGTIETLEAARDLLLYHLETRGNEALSDVVLDYLVDFDYGRWPSQ